MRKATGYGLGATGLLAALVAAGACTTSGTINEPGIDAGTIDGAVPADGATPPAPPTWPCSGDATSCLQGKVDASAFTTPLVGGVVELYRVFPSGAIAPVKSEPLAVDDTFAFSGLAAWAHYYVKVAAHFGTGMAAASVGTLAGRFAVPSTGAPIGITVIPVQLELLETGAGAGRKINWVSAHVFDPATGMEDTAGTSSVTFKATGIAETAMPFAAGDGGVGTARFYLPFSPPAAASTGYTVTVGGHAWSIATEADFAGAVSSPADGMSVPASQPLVVTWPVQAEADYMAVDLYSRNGSQFIPRFDSGDAIAPDVTTLTIPRGVVPTGTLLLDVNAARAACRLASDGCAYLIEAGAVNLTGQ